MALDKLVDSTQLDSDLGDVADAIRAKSGGTSQLAFPVGFISEIQSIQTGGGGGGGDASLADVDVYIADYVTEVPTITSGALNSRYGYIVGV